MGSADSSSSNSSAAAPGDVVPPAEKKYKPLNTTPNATKEIKVKIIPPQRESSAGMCFDWEQNPHGNECVGTFLLSMVFLRFPLISFFSR